MKWFATTEVKICWSLCYKVLESRTFGKLCSRQGEGFDDPEVNKNIAEQVYSEQYVPAVGDRSRLSLCAQSFMFWNKRMC